MLLLLEGDLEGFLFLFRRRVKWSLERNFYQFEGIGSDFIGLVKP